MKIRYDTFTNSQSLLTNTNIRRKTVFQNSNIQTSASQWHSSSPWSFGIILQWVRKGSQWHSKSVTTLQPNLLELVGTFWLLIFDSFAKNAKTESEALRQLVTEIERSSNIDHEEDQSNHALWTLLWFAIENHDWALHKQRKAGIEDVLPNRGKGTHGFNSKYEFHSMRRPSCHTLTRSKIYEEDEEHHLSSSESNKNDEEKTHQEKLKTMFGQRFE